jgi:hypothetical protein
MVVVVIQWGKGRRREKALDGFLNLHLPGCRWD